jgi:hypothetical protein
MAHEELTSIFGVRQQNEWKASVSEFLTEKDCEMLCKLYEDVYAQPPLNGDYLVFFYMVSWFSVKGVQANWAQYVHDTTHQQLKRATRLAPCGRPKLSLTITAQSTQNNVHLTDKDGQDEECFLLKGLKELNVFTPN